MKRPVELKNSARCVSMKLIRHNKVDKEFIVLLGVEVSFLV